MSTRPPLTAVAVGVARVATALAVIGRPRYGSNRSVRITGCRIEQMLDAVIAEMVGDPLADDIAVIAVTQTG